MTIFYWVFASGWIFSPLPARDLRGAVEPSGGIRGAVRSPLSPRDLGAGASLDVSKVAKRSSEPDGQMCKTLPELGSRLKNNTHTFSFHVRSMDSLSLAWVGDGAGVLLVLTTFQVPLSMMRFGQSNLYRSEDYGKTFEDVTRLINYTFVQTEFGIAVSPDHSGKVILTCDLSDMGGSRLFRSQDFGRSFVSTELPFVPLIPMLYNPAEGSTMVTLSVLLDLWLSEDFGATWRKIHNRVCLVRWGQNNSIYLTTNTNGSCKGKGMLELRRSKDYGRSFHTIATRVFSFVLGGRFVFASIMTGTGTERVIHVSLDGGDVWNMAQLPTVNHEQFYSILTATQDMVFMHVDDPGDSGVGTLYVSDDRGTVFSRSLERHLYTSTGSDTDFTAVASLRGVYMSSVLTEENSVQTVITFDQGATWRPLRSPQSGICDTNTTTASTSKADRCRLHIHAHYSITQKMNIPMMPLSQSNAVGLILAHGSSGDPESVLSPDVYVSDDGGYSWSLALKGPHHYAILDSGGLLVAVEHTSSAVHQIKFSTDEGQCWRVYNFTDDPLHFSGMDTEAGSRSMNVSLWGYRTDFRKWVVVTIDFQSLLLRDCRDEDYVQWLAHSSTPGALHDGCLLGYKESYRRLRKGSVCWNGRSYIVGKEPTPCPCTKDDFHCDFGFYRSENSSECVEQEELKEHPLQFCLNGSTQELHTSGYRKIPGDLCEGGFQPTRKENDLRKLCISSRLYPTFLTEVNTSHAAVVSMVVIALLLMSAVAGVWLVKKYVCGGRFLVHRYSVMKEHAEADETEGANNLDARSIEMEKTHCHEDTNQDLL